MPGTRSIATTVCGTLVALHLAGAQGQAAEDQTNIPALTHAYNASGVDLFRQFAASSGNIAFSPYSIGTAMAMALAGARDKTQTEMATVLRHRLGATAINAANAEVLAILNGYDTSGNPGTCVAGARLNGKRCEAPQSSDGRCTYPLRRDGELCVGPAIMPPSAKLSAANALMLLGRGDLIAKDYVTLLEKNYRAEVFPDADVAKINRWIEEKTAGKIRNMLDGLDPNVPAVLINAVYFKSRWNLVFDKALTKNETFRLTKSQKADVPTMHHTGNYAVAAGAGYRAIRLPYEVKSLAMIVVLPNEADGLGHVIDRTDAGQLSGLFATLRKDRKGTPVALSLPSFKVEFKADLVKPFRQVGMRLAFDPKAADFSGMMERPDTGLYLGAIRHRAVVEVSEESTEAAAATVVVPTARSSRRRPEPKPEEFRADRPFGFFIVDDSTGAILFAGRVSDPRVALASN
jgi:serpin B